MLPAHLQPWSWEWCDKDLPPDLKREAAEMRYLSAWCENQPSYSKATKQVDFETKMMMARENWLRWDRQRNIPAKSEKDQTEAEPRWYFGTFTQPDTNKSPHEILKNTVKVIKSKMVFPIISWCYSLELMKNGTPHTHFAFLTARRVEYSKVNAFNCSELKIKQRSETNAARYPQQAIDYVLKTDTKPSDEWLTENNLTQCIWKSDNCPGLVCPMSPGGPNIK